MKKIIYITVLLNTLFSCTNDSTNDLLEPIPEVPVISYNNTVKAIIDNNCTNCHSNPPINGAPNPLTTYLEVVNSVNNNLIERIEKQPGENGAMPLGAPRLPQPTIDQIIAWRANNTPEN